MHRRTQAFALFSAVTLLSLSGFMAPSFATDKATNFIDSTQIDSTESPGQHAPIGICHSGNGTNYVFIAPDDDGVVNGHDGHPFDFIIDGDHPCPPVPPLDCDDGEHEENGECVPDPLDCSDGEHEENGQCVPDPLDCDDGEHEDDGECVPDPLDCDVILAKSVAQENEPFCPPEDGSITIHKYTDTETSDTFTFEIESSGDDSFSHEVSDLGTYPADSGAIPVPGDAAYDVTETDLSSEWSLGSSYCYGGQEFTDTSEVYVAAGANLDCYFFNYTTRATIRIVKTTDVETGDKFDFDIDGEGDNDHSLDNVSAGGSGEISVPGGQPYTVSEVPHSGWVLDSASCEDDTPREQRALIQEEESPGSTTFHASEGHLYVCTFNNLEDDSGPFFPPSDACRNIDGIQSNVPEGLVADANGNCEEPPPPTDLCPNIEGAQESVPEGLVVDGAGDCVEPPPPPTDLCPNIDGTQETVPDGMVTDDLGNCVPADTASITIVNDIDDGSDQNATFSYTFQQNSPAAFRSLVDLGTDGGAVLGDGETATAADLAAGDYIATQIEKAGWDPPSIECDGDVTAAASAVTVHLGAGQHVTCTFSNHEEDEVLGEVIHNEDEGKPAARPSVRAGLLPFTGGRLLPLVYLGVAMVLIGGVLMRRGRRSPRGRHAWVLGLLKL